VPPGQHISTTHSQPLKVLIAFFPGASLEKHAIHEKAGSEQIRLEDLDEVLNSLPHLCVYSTSPFLASLITCVRV
jgi:hypothetical protein